MTDEPKITNDPVDCECDGCERRRSQGRNLYRMAQVSLWLVRAAFVAFLALGVAGVDIGAWVCALALLAAAWGGAVKGIIDSILSEPRLHRMLKRIYPTRPVYAPFLEEARVSDAVTVPEAEGTEATAIRFIPMPGGLGLGAKARRDTMAAILELHAQLWMIACATKDDPVRGGRLYADFSRLMREQQEPEDLLGYDGVGKPLTEELLWEVFSSYMRELQVSEDLRTEETTT